MAFSLGLREPSTDQSCIYRIERLADMMVIPDLSGSLFPVF